MSCLKIVFVCVFALSLLMMNVEGYHDSEAAATSDDHHGRVHIKVFRGPTEHDGHEHFAPWGFWVKQPADDDHY